MAALLGFFSLLLLLLLQLGPSSCSNVSEPERSPVLVVQLPDPRAVLAFNDAVPFPAGVHCVHGGEESRAAPGAGPGLAPRHARRPSRQVRPPLNPVDWLASTMPVPSNESRRRALQRAGGQGRHPIQLQARLLGVRRRGNGQPGGAARR